MRNTAPERIARGSLAFVPRISQFYGIVIAMYYDDHAPPHFHAYYSGEEATFRISDVSLLEGRLPRRAEPLVREWAAQHREELVENWWKARDAKPLDKIPGLE